MPTVLITGATSGLGYALAEKYAEAGWQLILSGRNLDKRPSLLGARYFEVPGDLRCPEVIEQLGQSAERLGIDVLINCAAVHKGISFMQSLTSDIDEELEINLLSPIRLTKRLWPLFVRQGYGVVMNVGSLAANSPGPNEATYAASKGGLQSFSKALQFDASRVGVRVLYVELGAMATPMTDGRPDQMKLIQPRAVANILFSFSTQPDSLRVPEISIQRGIY